VATTWAVEPPEEEPRNQTQRGDDVGGGTALDGFAEMRGFPKVVASNARSHDVEVQKRLWTVFEELTGVVYPVR
jgi:hypothetical protein